jgi:cell division protein FtsN
MKKRTIAITLLIFALIFSFSLFQACGKKKVPEKEVPEAVKPETPTVEKAKVAPEKELEQVPEEVKGEEKVFELQVVAVKDYSKINIEKNKLAQYGYNTKITTIEKDGETFYRLRLDGLYTYSEATKLGKKLKDQFPSIHEYWVQKVR